MLFLPILSLASLICSNLAPKVSKILPTRRIPSHIESIHVTPFILQCSKASELSGELILATRPKNSINGERYTALKVDSNFSSPGSCFDIQGETISQPGTDPDILITSLSFRMRLSQSFLRYENRSPNVFFETSCAMLKQTKSSALHRVNLGDWLMLRWYRKIPMQIAPKTPSLKLSSKELVEDAMGSSNDISLLLFFRKEK